jgi:DNA-binding IclR family transcriptional regulator
MAARMTAAKRKRAPKNKTTRKRTPSSRAALQELVREMKGIPDAYARTIGELLLQVVVRAESLPDDFFERLEAISVHGVDPDWQDAELAKLVKELKIRH